MRDGKVIALVILCVLAASLAVQAGTNKFGVSDIRDITFTGPTRVGDGCSQLGSTEFSTPWKVKTISWFSNK